MLPTPRVESDYRVYDPAEDSFFLLDCLEADGEYIRTKFKAPLCVEIGCGSGIVSAFLPSVSRNCRFILATDVNNAACITTQKSAPIADVAQTDLGSCLRPKSVDILVCNPPYVPSETVPVAPEDESSDKWLDLALDGGADGMEVTSKLLEKLPDLLSPNGSAYILFCASNHPKQIKAEMETKGWKVTDLGTRKAGWEVLSVYRFDQCQ